VAEAGSVDLVVRNPSHPYTRLLVSSIPVPNPEQQWAAEAAAAFPNQKRGHMSCKFAGRCPSAMAKCLQQAPRLYQTDPQRAAACFLYEGAPVLGTEEMDTLFRSPLP
jgi:peptide/nickel transport system ATP-binding protein